MFPPFPFPFPLSATAGIFAAFRVRVTPVLLQVSCAEAGLSLGQWQWQPGGFLPELRKHLRGTGSWAQGTPEGTRYRGETCPVTATVAVPHYAQLPCTQLEFPFSLGQRQGRGEWKGRGRGNSYFL